MWTTRSIALAVITIAAAVVAAPAQDRAADPPAVLENGQGTDAFGGGTQDYVVPAVGCNGRTASPRWVHSSSQRYGNDVAVPGGGSAACPIYLPSGARVTGIECFVYDASTVGNVNVQLVETAVFAASGLPVGGATAHATLASSGSGGFQVLNAAPSFTTRRRVGGERRLFWLFIGLPSDTVANIAFQECTIFWNREVTPAPATATFADVPVGHPQRQFVEALAAAGITGGCGPGIFCPDAPLTRGQMATFLAVALGLHFPN